jgi:hypothetical protein
VIDSFIFILPLTDRDLISAADHNRIFYLHLIEECRSWMCTLPYLSPDGRDQDEVISFQRGISAGKRQHQGPAWHSASVKQISHFLETNHCLEPNEIGNSDPRLGQLLILNTTIIPKNVDSWSDLTPDLRPGDLVMMKSYQLGSRFFDHLSHSLDWPP